LERGGGFADYTMTSIHFLRIYLETPYKMVINILTEILRVTGKISQCSIRQRYFLQRRLGLGHKTSHSSRLRVSKQRAPGVRRF